nr:RNA-directed DNA polymerase, eukaryota [Tanacetum cinerariifolium]
MNMENSKKSFVFILKCGSQSHVTPEITKPALVLDETCIKEFDFGMSLMGRAKYVYAIPNLPCIISKEGLQNVKLSYLGGMWVLFEFDFLASKEKFLNHSDIGSWFTELIQAISFFENDERIVWISIEDDQDDLSSDGESQEGDVANKADNNESDVDRVSESSFMHENDTAHKDMFDYVVGSSVGCSGCILCMWNPNMFVKEQVSTCDYFVALMGTWAKTSSKLLIISVYTPQELNKRHNLWDYLRTFIDRWEGDTMIMGDFNEVRSEHESFISSACLIDLPLEGYAFTWAHKSASKMSKLDRYIISEGVLDLFPHLSALCLDRHLFDPRPILLRETNYDYGPYPFSFFHSWFAMEGFNSFVETTWKSLNIVEPNGLIRLKKKLQALKIAIKAWSKEANKRSNDKKINIQQNLLEVDKLIDQEKSNDEILIERITLLNDLQELNNRNDMEISQKAKIQWSIEGDENSKYFHGIMNEQRSQLTIRGTLADGEWISKPHRVKNEFFTHFKKQYSPIQAPSICFDFTFPTRLSSDQV